MVWKFLKYNFQCSFKYVFARGTKSKIMLCYRKIQTVILVELIISFSFFFFFVYVTSAKISIYLLTLDFRSTIQI